MGTHRVPLKQLPIGTRVTRISNKGGRISIKACDCVEVIIDDDTQLPTTKVVVSCGGSQVLHAVGMVSSWPSFTGEVITCELADDVLDLLEQQARCVSTSQTAT